MQTPLTNKTITLAIGTLGVVYGDIGTSPLYTVKECFHGEHAIALNQENLFGVMSLIFWSLTIVVCIKYVIYVLRADNHGEGGIFALIGLIMGNKAKMTPRQLSFAVGAGILGAGLLNGEGIITPAISVLSAIEGLEVATKAATPFILPLTCLILFLIFFFQYRGTADIGKVFGPVMLVWFGAIAALGLGEIFKKPQILLAIHPGYAYAFFAGNQLGSIVVFGSVVLCLTGCEALYADLGHFGRRAIRLSWGALVYPSLLCNYFGQTALLLDQPEMSFHPFYGLVPRLFLYPMVGLSTLATVIASQALISGVFSLTRQAVELGFFPRTQIVHTSQEIEGQIYLPKVNYALMLACLGVTIAFRNSSGLAGAYGISVTGTMCITSSLFFIVATRIWGWPLLRAVPLVALFLIFDLSYFGANLLKVIDGGWFSLFVASILTVCMTTWRKGRNQVIQGLGTRLALELFLKDLSKHEIHRVKGTAVFMSQNPEEISPVLLHHLRHNQVLHKQVVLLTVVSTHVPYVPLKKGVEFEELGQGFYRVVAQNGYMQRLRVINILEHARTLGLPFNEAQTTYYLGRLTLFTNGNSGMRKWRKDLYAFMARNAGTPTAHFGLPANRVVELGAQVSF